MPDHHKPAGFTLAASADDFHMIGLDRLAQFPGETPVLVNPHLDFFGVDQFQFQSAAFVQGYHGYLGWIDSDSLLADLPIVLPLKHRGKALA